jgi:alpha-tubulin suppressor-like RCC1 family protein
MQDGSLWTWGRNDAGQLGNGTTVDRLIKVQIGPGTGWTTAAAGSRHTLAVRLTDGRLLAWGENDTGQLGDNTAWIESPIELK